MAHANPALLSALPRSGQLVGRRRRLGAWNDWEPHSRQSHRAGPAVFGTWRAADGAIYKLQAAWLVGRTY